MRSVLLVATLAACGSVEAPENVTLEPSAPRTTDPLRLSIDAPDTDSVEVRWSIDGVAAADLDDMVQVDPSRTAKGQRWQADVVAVRGSRRSPNVTVGATIVDSPPSGTGAVITPGSPTTLDALSCAGQGFADPDGDAERWRFSWKVDAGDAGEGPTLAAGAAARGQRVTCVATPVGDGLDGPSVQAEVVIQDAPPSLGGVTLEPEAPTVATPLRAVPIGASDADGDAVGVSWAWTVDGAVVEGATDVLTGGSFARGQTVAVVATPVANGLSGRPVTASVVIGNAAPSAPVVRVSPRDVIYDDDDLICEIEVASVDPDGDAVAYIVSWTREGAAWTGATATTTLPGDTIRGTQTLPGEVWTCAVVATDGDAASDPGTATAEVSRCALVEYEILARQSICVSPSTGSIWRDNRVRAYTDSSLRIYGWVSFDLSSVDPTATIVEASLELYEEWGSIQGAPRMVLVESSTVGWTRSTATASTFAVGETVSDTFTAFSLRGWNTFPIDLDRWDWDGALERDEATLAVHNLETTHSFVYFHGADSRAERARLQLLVEECD